MILFTSASNVAYYVYHGELFWFYGYQWLLSFVAFFAALLGRLTSSVMATRLAHPSFIAFALALVLGVSVVLVVVRSAQVRARTHQRTTGPERL